MGGPGAIRHEKSRGIPRRVRAKRPFRKTVLIVGEGRETEPNYFNGLTDEDAVSTRFAVRVTGGPGFSPERVVKRAINLAKQAERRGDAFDEVWCVLDVEGPQTRESLGRARQMAAEADIRLCLSNPSFEVWLLSHFVRRARAYSGWEAVVADLNKPWQARFGRSYEKNDARIYERLASLTQVAVKNARWVRETHHRAKPDTIACNSSTDVYQLVEHLTGPVASATK